MKFAFIIPAYRRFELTRVCLRQLKRTCTAMDNNGFQATAVVVGDDENLATAQELGFGTVEQANRPLGRKWNDGIEYACAYLGCQYVMPFGTDNWIDPDLAMWLPGPDEILAHRLATIVHQDGHKAVTIRVAYPGGDGIRCLPASLLRVLDFRPCDEDKERATDTSMRDRLTTKLRRPPSFRYVDLHPLQVVSFQSHVDQLNDYDDLAKGMGIEEYDDPWDRLATAYSSDAIFEVRTVIESRHAGGPISEASVGAVA